MRSTDGISSERYVVCSIIVSLIIAAAASQIPMLSFGSFSAMATVLIIADLVIYAAMKTGLIRTRRK